MQRQQKFKDWRTQRGEEMKKRNVELPNKSEFFARSKKRRKRSRPGRLHSRTSATLYRPFSTRCRPMDTFTTWLRKRSRLSSYHGSMHRFTKPWTNSSSLDLLWMVSYMGLYPMVLAPSFFFCFLTGILDMILFQLRAVRDIRESQ
jgi:hypothetical protein